MNFGRKKVKAEFYSRKQKIRRKNAVREFKLYSPRVFVVTFWAFTWWKYDALGDVLCVGVGFGFIASDNGMLSGFEHHVQLHCLRMTQSTYIVYLVLRMARILTRLPA